MKNSKLFQYIVIGAFVFFIIIGAILFSTYRSNNKNEVQINITVWGTLSADALNSFVSRYFSDKQLKYTVNYVEKSATNFDRDLIEALASRVGPDAIVLPEDLVARFSDKIYSIPFTILPELNFKQTFIQEGELYLNKDGVLAVPFSVDPLVMYWNRDIFNNAGVTKPPTTWTEISALIPKMTKKDQAQNILSSTVALGEFRNVNNAKEILSALIIQAGDKVIGSDTNGALSSTLKDNQATSLALQFYTNFSNPVKKDYSWNRAMPNSLDVFANGDLSMYFGFASEYIKIKNKNPNLNFDVAVLPQIANAKTLNTFGNILGFAIMKDSKDPAGAYTVINALTSAEAFPFWTTVFNVPSARRDILGQTEPNAIKSVFNKSAILSKGWLDPNYSETSRVFQEMVESYTTGRENLDTSISTASDRLNNLLK